LRLVVDVLKDKQALQRLIEAAERANIELSSFIPAFDCWISLCDAYSLSCCFSSLPFTTATADGPEHINATSTKTIRRIVCRFAGQVGDLFFLVICLGLIAGYFLHNANQ
jgi:hypothetical protein